MQPRCGWDIVRSLCHHNLSLNYKFNNDFLSLRNEKKMNNSKKYFWISCQINWKYSGEFWIGIQFLVVLFFTWNYMDKFNFKYFFHSSYIMEEAKISNAVSVSELPQCLLKKISIQKNLNLRVFNFQQKNWLKVLLTGMYSSQKVCISYVNFFFVWLHSFNYETPMKLDKN